MKKFKFILILISFFACSQSYSAIFYVGNGAQCNVNSLSLALLGAIINGDESDEIRLTNSVNYTGQTNGSYTLSGFNSKANGDLSIIGGYETCTSADSSGMTLIGENQELNPIFDIKNESVVLLQNIQVTESDSTGISVQEASILVLQSSTVDNNDDSGISVFGGSGAIIDSGSLITENGSDDGVLVDNGGGIRCTGNSYIAIQGDLLSNYAYTGGNMYIDSGCFVSLQTGSSVSYGQADSGAGVYVGNGGELNANGDSGRISFSANIADNGGAIYVEGTGKATLTNAFIDANVARIKGTGLYASNGGSAELQVIMDRNSNCNTTSCSEFKENEIRDNLIYISGSKVRISRTIIQDNYFNNNTVPTETHSLIEVKNNGLLEMEYSSMVKNKINYLIYNRGDSELSHITALGNYYPAEITGNYDSYIWLRASGNLRIENSLLVGTQGGQNAPNTSSIISGKCNLIDNNYDWPDNSYIFGQVIFTNLTTGRQSSSSDGVDMCLRNTFPWTSSRDIEYQIAPINETTNPQGFPGEIGGFFDAGFDEVFDNIGSIELIFKNGFE